MIGKVDKYYRKSGIHPLEFNCKHYQECRSKSETLPAKEIKTGAICGKPDVEMELLCKKFDIDVIVIPELLKNR